MTFHILTACARAWNLPALAESIVAGDPYDEAVWHVGLDAELKHVGGQAVKNRLLDETQGGYVVVLDDDTTLHPELLPTARRSIMEEDADLVVVSQSWPGGVRHASAGAMVVGGVDIGQAVVSRHLIGPDRIPETYDGDGHWLAGLAARALRPVYVDRVLAHYNALEASHA